MDGNSLKKLYASMVLAKDGRYFDKKHSMGEFPKLAQFYEEAMIP
jgi:hypothetical protein